MPPNLLTVAASDKIRLIQLRLRSCAERTQAGRNDKWLHRRTDSQKKTNLTYVPTGCTKGGLTLQTGPG